jgi:uncharacterized protein YkwD
MPRSKSIVKRRRVALLAVMIIAAAMAARITTPAAAQGDLDEFVYLPLVAKQDCQANANEARIAELMRSDPQQQRPSLTCHPILAQVARERAEDMAARRYFAHVNPDGYGPNCLVIQAGYPLPAWYAPCPAGNNIESIAGGYSTPDSTWQGWMNSSPHRTHLLGLHPFFAEQVEYGVGYAYDADSPYRHYWVVITARRE